MRTRGSCWEPCPGETGSEPLSASTRESGEIDLPIALWFGILTAVNLQTAWLSPPVALLAYFLKGVAPHWQLAGLALLMMLPQLALWLPGVLYTR
jgi:TRAP-type mannitol/chloroaromatic compound transport system permease large subunit